jgi:hypothetical protein
MQKIFRVVSKNEKNQSRSENRLKDGMLPRYGILNKKEAIASVVVSTIFLFAIFVIIKKIGFELLIAVGIVFIREIIQDMIIYNEFYKIQNRVVTVKKIFSKKEVVLPENLVLIVSRGSVSLGGRISYMKRPGFIKLDCLMICIVSNCTVQEALRFMQWNGYSKENRYSNVIVREIFLDNTYSKFLFSFAYNKAQLQKLVENHNVEIILPKSLKSEIDLGFFSDLLHIDEEN